MSGQRRRVALEVITRDMDHCSNDCDFMMNEANQARCHLFGHNDLHWDPRRKVHGYKRSAACKDAEINEEP